MNDMTISTFRKDAWMRLLNPVRYPQSGMAYEQINRTRNPFAVDYDRILFSSSFRRLSKKTQVHPLSRNDHIHNRLTHSLEVSSVGRSIGTCFGYILDKNNELPDAIHPEYIGEIVQAACLAHDIGNPPFGHAGESAIQDWFKDPENSPFLQELTPSEIADFTSFDGNAQGFRVVNVIENNKDNGGFRLTYPTIATMVKYPNSAHEAEGSGSRKFNYYQSEKEIFDTIFSTLGLKDARYKRHPLSYLSEASDDICYRIIDMEDARELKILSFDDILTCIAPLNDSLKIDEDKLYKMDSDRRRATFVRTCVIGELSKIVLSSLESNYKEILDGKEIPSLIKISGDAINEYMKNAKDIFYKRIINEPKKTALEIGSYSLYKRLLDVFIPACFYTKKNSPLSYKQQRALCLMGINAPTEQDTIYKSYLRVIDFITGMTDCYATFISEQFSGTASG